MPVLALGAGYIPAFGGNPNTAAQDVMKLLAQNITGIIVPNSGHYIQEEQPDVVVKLLNNFFSGNSTSNVWDLTHNPAIVLSHYIFQHNDYVASRYSYNWWLNRYGSFNYLSYFLFGKIISESDVYIALIDDAFL